MHTADGRLIFPRSTQPTASTDTHRQTDRRTRRHTRRHTAVLGVTTTLASWCIQTVGRKEAFTPKRVTQFLQCWKISFKLHGLSQRLRHIFGTRVAKRFKFGLSAIAELLVLHVITNFLVANIRSSALGPEHNTEGTVSK